MATTTKRHEIEKLAHSRVRIKEFVDSEGDIVYKVQHKKWYGWSSISDDIFLPISITYMSYERAKKVAEEQIEKEINKLIHHKTKFYYFPF